MPCQEAPDWVHQVETSHSVPADLGGDCRAAGGHPASGGGSILTRTQKLHPLEQVCVRQQVRSHCALAWGPAGLSQSPVV